MSLSGLKLVLGLRGEQLFPLVRKLPESRSGSIAKPDLKVQAKKFFGCCPKNIFVTGAMGKPVHNDHNRTILLAGLLLRKHHIFM